MPEDEPLTISSASADLHRPSLHRIVIVGGGAAGSELATRLGDTLGKRRKADITLIDRGRTHIWKPMLHAVAAGSMNSGAHELNYMAQARWHHFRFQYGAMTGLDREKKLVLLAATHDEEGREITSVRAIPYDTLVIAIGSVTNDFGTPGAAQYAVPLETLDQAVRFNHRLVNACVRAQAQEMPVRPGQLHVAVIGAGATGTELAAELHKTARQVIAFGLERISVERDVKIILIEAAPRILPALPERISEATRRAAAQARRRGPHRRACERSAGGRRLPRGRHVHPVRTRRLVGGREGARCAQDARPGDEPDQPDRRQADVADRHRPEHLRDRRCGRMPAPRLRSAGAAARAGRAPDGVAFVQAAAAIIWPASR